MADLDPITRTEMFLAGNEPDLTPITREEVILVADLISMGFSGVHTMEERSATTLT